MLISRSWHARPLGGVLLRGNLRSGILGQHFCYRWPNKDLILQASDEAKELFSLLKFLFAVDEVNTLEPHTRALITKPSHSVQSLACLNSRRERLTNNELHRGSLAPIVDASHGEFIFSDDKFEGLLVKETQNSVVDALIDAEYRYIPAKFSSYHGRELRVEEAKNGTIAQPLPHIFDSLLVCGQINGRLCFELRWLVGGCIENIVVDGEPKGIYYSSLNSFGVTVVGSSSETYAEAANDQGVELDRITKNERVRLIKDDQTAWFGDKVKSNLVNHRLSRAEQLPEDFEVTLISLQQVLVFMHYVDRLDNSNHVGNRSSCR